MVFIPRTPKRRGKKQSVPHLVALQNGRLSVKRQRLGSEDLKVSHLGILLWEVVLQTHKVWRLFVATAPSVGNTEN